MSVSLAEHAVSNRRNVILKQTGITDQFVVASLLAQLLQTYVNVNVLYLSGLQVNYEMFPIDKTPRVKKFGDLA